MKIVITGTTGFVGTNLQSFLQSKGYETVALNRKAKGGTFSTDRDIPVSCSGSVWIHLAGKSKDIDDPRLLDEYLNANVELTKKIFHAFIQDVSASTFIYVSSVKAAAAHVEGLLTETEELEVDVPYGFSKRLAEKYLLGEVLPSSKKLVILRPAMIYGPNSKGNLFSLFSFVRKGVPYPFSAFTNSRSLLSIDNFNWVIFQIINSPGFSAGVYNIADEGVISTNEIIAIIGKSIGKRPIFLRIPKKLILLLGKLGDKFRLPFNQKVIGKLTESYAVSNTKLVDELGHPLPYKTRESLEKLFELLAHG